MRSRNPCVFLIKSVTHTQIVNDYIHKYQALLNNDLAWYAQPPNWNDKIKRAVASKGRCGQLHEHQWRLRKSVYGAAEKKLLAAAKMLQLAKTFDDLYDEVEKQVSSIAGVGPLCIYEASSNDT